MGSVLWYWILEEFVTKRDVTCHVIAGIKSKYIYTYKSQYGEWPNGTLFQIRNLRALGKKKLWRKKRRKFESFVLLLYFDD